MVPDHNPQWHAQPPARGDEPPVRPRYTTFLPKKREMALMYLLVYRKYGRQKDMSKNTEETQPAKSRL